MTDQTQSPPPDDSSDEDVETVEPREVTPERPDANRIEPREGSDDRDVDPSRRRATGGVESGDDAD